MGPEPTYDTRTRGWSHLCQCIQAEQLDPECPWHGREARWEGGIGGAQCERCGTTTVVRELEGVLICRPCFTSFTEDYRDDECLACAADRQECSELSGCCDRCDHR